MRNAAITGRPESLFTNLTARQGGRWAEQTVGAAVAGAPRAPAAPGVGATRAPLEPEELRALHDAGTLTDSELELALERLQA
jgi:hypothetical protein